VAFREQGTEGDGPVGVRFFFEAPTMVETDHDVISTYPGSYTPRHVGPT
jgi:hypothetical protein